jgi:hypothetical protein
VGGTVNVFLSFHLQDFNLMLSQLELVRPPLIKLLWRGLCNLHNDKIKIKKRIFACSPKQLTLVYGGAVNRTWTFSI